MIRTQIDSFGDYNSTVELYPYNVHIEMFFTLLSFKGLLNLSEFLQFLAYKGTCLLNKNNSHEGRTRTYACYTLPYSRALMYGELRAPIRPHGRGTTIIRLRDKLCPMQESNPRHIVLGTTVLPLN